jgi:hypothetical protein
VKGKGVRDYAEQEKPVKEEPANGDAVKGRVSLGQVVRRQL